MNEAYTHSRELDAMSKIAKVRTLVSSDEEMELLKKNSKRAFGEKLIHLSILLKQAGEIYIQVAREEKERS